MADTTPPDGHIPEVLFVCVHNQGRSQMAAGLLNHHAQGRVLVRSAGSAPADSVNPAVVEVMAEVGIDISQEFPKKLLTEDVAASDVVVTMGCGDACPIFPGKRYEDWALTDPSGKGPDSVRDIRDEIDQRVQNLLADLRRDASRILHSASSASCEGPSRGGPLSVVPPHPHTHAALDPRQPPDTDQPRHVGPPHAEHH